MNPTHAVRRALRAFLLFALTVMTACGEDQQAAIEETMDQMQSAAQRGDGEAFASLLAPESFDHYARLLKLALDGTPRQLDALSLSEQLEVILMRNRCTRKDVAGLDGRGWVVYAVNKGWYGGVTFDEEAVFEKNVRLRGSTATLVVVYDAYQPRSTGEGSGKRWRDEFTFLKVGDRWLADWRRDSVLLERLVTLIRQQRPGLSMRQVVERIEAKLSGKELARDIWETPMR